MPVPLSSQEVNISCSLTLAGNIKYTRPITSGKYCSCGWPTQATAQRAHPEVPHGLSSHSMAYTLNVSKLIHDAIVITLSSKADYKVRFK